VLIAVWFGGRRKRLAVLLLVGLLPFLSAMVPLLDRGEAFYAPVFTSEQGYPSGALAHDHTICVRFAANATLVSVPEVPTFHQAETIDRVASHHRCAPAVHRVLPRSRSPPVS
jgi:hypothetical protein